MWGEIKKNLISGIVFLAPIAVTIYIGYWILTSVIITPNGEAWEITGIPALNQAIQIIVSLIILIIVLVSIGYLVRKVLDKYARDWRDKIMNKIPGLRVVYKSTKLAADTVSNKSEKFEKPVKIDFHGYRMTAFKTGETKDGRELIFMPTTPNITTGFLLEVEEEKLEPVDETVEEALTRLLSIGFGDSEKKAKEKLP